MKLAINQPYFFPYIGYFQLIESVDKFIIYDLVKFQKRSWMTKNRLINFSSGEPFNIFIPVRSSEKIADVKISTPNYNLWVNQFLKVLFHNYRRAEYFSETYSTIEYILKNMNTDKLHLFNTIVIRHICRHLDIDTEIQYRNDKFYPLEKELDQIYNEHGIIPNIDKKTMRVFRICELESASTYINLPSGTSLYHPRQFKEQNLNLSFLQLPEIEYRQFNFKFTPYLSIIDVLMHLGQNQTKEIVSNYKLAENLKACQI